MKAIQILSVAPKRSCGVSQPCWTCFCQQSTRSFYQQSWIVQSSHFHRSLSRHSNNTISISTLQTIAKRTDLSAREPRKRLPVQVQAIKKEVYKMQQLVAKHRQSPQQRLSFFGMIFGVTAVTYTVCYLALDPDWIAEVQVELRHNGILPALNYALFGKKTTISP